MNTELEYIIRALEEQQTVVIVQTVTFAGQLLRRSIKYISNNADRYGMNKSAIMNGFRLPIDYLHPEDREDFVSALMAAREAGTNYSYRARLVGDNGMLHTVDFRIIFLSIGESETDIEYIIHDAETKTVNTESKVEKEIEVKEKEPGSEAAAADTEHVLNVLAENNLAEFFQNISCAFNLYSSIVDVKGRILTRPVGPESFLGDFYDLFERPHYRELYRRLRKRVQDEGEPFITDMGNGNPDNLISAAPIYVEDKYVATWLLCAYDRKQAEDLKAIYKKQWAIADNVSTYMVKINTSVQKAEKLKKLEEDTEKHIRQKEIISDAIMNISGGMACISNLFEAAGTEMKVDYIAMFGLTSPESDTYEYKRAWFSHGRNKTVIDSTWKTGRYPEEYDTIRKKGCLIIDNKNMTNRVRVGIFRGNVRAVMIYPAVIDEKESAYIVFCENQAERTWTENDIAFAKEVSETVGRILRYTNGEENADEANKTLLDIYNYLSVGIFIKDDQSGRVVFSNRTMNNMLGYDFTGGDSSVIIAHSGNAMGFGDNDDRNKVTNWRKYIESLVKIVDITEIRIKWLNGEPASVYIVRPVEE
ncbi:MAG: hypothetical protein IJJ74_03730 [Eubacterium sp.]|nr:hypothetical protein [Eubacterium sp.]MBR1675459.1 hypothetical protein [Eubacterium sp.]